MAQTVKWRMSFQALTSDAKAWLRRAVGPRGTTVIKAPKGYKGPDGSRMSKKKKQPGARR